MASRMLSARIVKIPKVAAMTCMFRAVPPRHAAYDPKRLRRHVYSSDRIDKPFFDCGRDISRHSQMGVSAAGTGAQKLARRSAGVGPEPRWPPTPRPGPGVHVDDD